MRIVRTGVIRFDQNRLVSSDKHNMWYEVTRLLVEDDVKILFRNHFQCRMNFFDLANVNENVRDSLSLFIDDQGLIQKIHQSTNIRIFDVLTFCDKYLRFRYVSVQNELSGNGPKSILRMNGPAILSTTPNEASR